MRPIPQLWGGSKRATQLARVNRWRLQNADVAIEGNQPHLLIAAALGDERPSGSDRTPLRGAGHAVACVDCEHRPRAHVARGKSRERKLPTPELDPILADMDAARADRGPL